SPPDTSAAGSDTTAGAAGSSGTAARGTRGTCASASLLVELALGVAVVRVERLHRREHCERRDDRQPEVEEAVHEHPEQRGRERNADPDECERQDRKSTRL